MTDRPQAAARSRAGRPPPTPAAGRRCGSCARPAGRCRSTARCAARASRCSTPCRRPDLATEITLQPVRRYGVDAAIFFSDIVVPLAAIGFDLDIVPGVGPVVAEPFRTRADLDRLRPLEPGRPSRTSREAVRQLVAELGPTPLIGFAGAPFTLASYLVEGGPSRDLRPDQGADATATPPCGATCSTGSPRSRRTFLAGRRSRPAPPPSSCSTPGPARCRSRTTSTTSCRRPPRCSSRWPSSACRGSTSASAPASCSRSMGERGRRRRRRRLACPARRGRAPGRPGEAPCRATSTRRCSSRPARCCASRGAGGRSRRRATRPATSSTWATACRPDADPDVLARRRRPRPRARRSVTASPDGRGRPAARGRRRRRGLGADGGLAAGHAVRDAPRVIVLEQSPRVGGKLLRAGSSGGHEVDLGAESVLARRPEARRPAARARARRRTSSTRRLPARAWCVGGRLYPLPAGTRDGRARPAGPRSPAC